MGINTKSVLDTAETKWNFLNFTPGLVGGHCIGVDPYYLTYKAEQLGYHSQIILAGRKINDAMGKYVAENLVKKIISAGISVKNANVAILGVTFKENCPDIRNTKIMDIIKELHEYGIRPVISDPLANDKDASDEYKINLTDIKEIENMDAVILAVAHNEYKSLSIESLNNLYKKDIQKKILLDLKNLIDHQQAKQAGYLYWSL
jgi:UDP-N-acetyl-D-galactosamine dehydrogenase